MRKLVAGALAVVAVTAPAHADWSVSADIERFRWAESTEPKVTETGPVFGIGARFRHERPAGWQYGWQGRLYFGSLDYKGSFLGTDQPATGTTEYGGLVNELEAAYRLPGNPYGLEVTSGLIFDYWNRQLSRDQREEYWIASLRLGLQADARASTGWFGGGGLKLPFYTREDAHLTSIGFNANPKLEPKGAPSLYASLGYRFSRAFSLVGYYDGYRFRESEPTPSISNPFVPGCAPPAGCQLVQPTSKKDSVGLRLQYRFD